MNIPTVIQDCNDIRCLTYSLAQQLRNFWASRRSKRLKGASKFGKSMMLMIEKKSSEKRCFIPKNKKVWMPCDEICEKEIWSRFLFQYITTKTAPVFNNSDTWNNFAQRPAEVLIFWGPFHKRVFGVFGLATTFLALLGVQSCSSLEWWITMCSNVLFKKMT